MSMNYLREGFAAVAAANAAKADPRHEGADVSPVTIERSDAIDAAGALLMMARDYRRQAKARANGGPDMATYRRGLRAQADVFEAAARRVQSAADAAG
jgi:hypothetical protein